MGFFTVIFIMYVLLSVSLYKVFEKAGVEGWKALVPGLNFMEWCTLIGRPKWWAALMLIPIVNIFILSAMSVDLVRSFNKLSFFDSFLAVVFPPVIFSMIGFKEEEKYDSPILPREQEYAQQLAEAQQSGRKSAYERLMKQNPYKKNPLREWTESIVFAVFAAAFIRMFLIEAYVIPTSSMEGSLMVGDYLFVSKAHYGVRMPQTIAMLPLLHNRAPFIDAESYWEKPSLPYKRLPALETLDRNDPVVFNFPMGDSVYVFPTRTWSAEDHRLGATQGIPSHARAINKGKSKLITRPMDKKDHYVKRCIAVAGDSMQIINREVYINGKAVASPTNVQYFYLVRPSNGQLNGKDFMAAGISREDVQRTRQEGVFGMVLNDSQKEMLKKQDPGIQIEYFDMGQFDGENSNRLFPHDPKNFPGWTVDNYGPVYVPKAGVTVDISPANISLYSRIIDVYEDNDLEVKGGKVYINGSEASQYTFKMDYYWMMGDNRHRSEDSRVWGFVPADHIVGKPLFIWFSTIEGNMANGINWSRIFTSASKF